MRKGVLICAFAIFCCVGCDYSNYMNPEYQVYYQQIESKKEDENNGNDGEEKKENSESIDNNAAGESNNQTESSKENVSDDKNDVKNETENSENGNDSVLSEGENLNKEDSEDAEIIYILPEKNENNQNTQTENEEQSETKKEDVEIDAPEGPEIKERLWNILIYMSADNNLETAGVEDILEMELSCLDTEVVSVFVLFDRSPAYDTTNDNWSGTRLYKLETGKKNSNRNIVSQEIECSALGLVVGKETELDMSAGYVLEESFSYLMDRYPASNYGLIIWGHGTGWRGSENDSNMESDENVFKGFAFDETSKTYMTLRQFGKALGNCLNQMKLGFIGFDTCFGSELEVLYEIRNYADYAVGSEGLINSSGWNYTNILNSIQNDSEKSAYSICKNLVGCFKEEYKNSIGASIAMVDLGKVKSYFDCFDDYMSSVAKWITNETVRDEVFGLVYTNNNCDTDKYTYGTANNDIYLDVHSLVENLYQYFESGKKEIIQKYSLFEQIECETIPDYWAYSSSSMGIGVYFSTLSAGNILAVSHPDSYIQGKTINQIDFVKDSKGYVPSGSSDSSFLNSLFYRQF